MSRQIKPVDLLGLIAIGVGLLLIVSGVMIGGDTGSSVRTLGGFLLIGGLGAVILVEPHRRERALALARGMMKRYRTGTAAWRWQYRTAMACLLLAGVMFVPALFLGTLFGMFMTTPFMLLSIMAVIASGVFFVCGLHSASNDESRRRRSP